MSITVFGLPRKSKTKKELCLYIAANPSNVDVTIENTASTCKYKGLLSSAPNGTYFIEGKGELVDNNKYVLLITIRDGKVVSIQ